MNAWGFERKIVPVGDPPGRLAQLARPIVLTNGVFDVLHRGHVTYLAQARSLGASLVVAINSDASVRLLGKGDDRPINSELDRATVVAALQSVNLVIIFDTQIPLVVIETVRPDIYVKGGDYDMEQIAETPLVRAIGGKVLALPVVHDRSTTKLLNRVRGAKP